MIKLLFAGDFIPPENTSNLFSEQLLSVLADKDFSLVNLEAPLTDGNTPIIKTGRNFKIAPGSSKALTKGHFDAVTLANNHIRDFGDQGVKDTLYACKQNNIHTIGAGINAVEAAKALRVTIKGVKISFLNYSEHEFNIAGKTSAGANLFDPVRAFYDIKAEKTDNDFVFVSYHGGIEYQHYPTLAMISHFRYMVDCGADGIVTHHSHRYSGFEYYKSKPIFYGLGNFLSSTIAKYNIAWHQGLMASITIGETSITAEALPVRIADNLEYVKLASGDEKKLVEKHIEKICGNIQNKDFLHNYWSDEYQKEEQRFINLLKSNSKTEYRLRKYIKFPFFSKISKYRILILLNFLRCESHRERISAIINTMYGRIQQ